MSVWVCIPSARPLCEVEAWRQAWASKGYRVALWRDTWPNPGELGTLDHLIVGAYPGYARAVNRLIHDAIVIDLQATWFVIGGDDTFPAEQDPLTIAEECTAHFTGTRGVMQPTGDRFAGGQIDRIAGSAWIGRYFARRIYHGRGPLWPEFTHMFVDEHLREVARKLGIYWERRDIVQLHRHFRRQSDRVDSPAVPKPIPPHLEYWFSRQHWDESKAIFERLKAGGFKEAEDILI